jgi:hypothetical protein
MAKADWNAATQRLNTRAAPAGALSRPQLKASAGP